MKPESETQWIEARAKAIGFDLCGVVRAEKFPELAHTEEWLAKGYAGEMKYLDDPRRANPKQVMPGIASVIVCALNYNAQHPRSTEIKPDESDEDPRGWISRYAWGSDYHLVLGEKLEASTPGRCKSASWPSTLGLRSGVILKGLQEILRGRSVKRVRKRLKRK